MSSFDVYELKNYLNGRLFVSLSRRFRIFPALISIKGKYKPINSTNKAQLNYLDLSRLIDIALREQSRELARRQDLFWSFFKSYQFLMNGKNIQM